MAHKYLVILCTLVGSGGDVWKKPREVLETIAALTSQEKNVLNIAAY